MLRSPATTGLSGPPAAKLPDAQLAATKLGVLVIILAIAAPIATVVILLTYLDLNDTKIIRDFISGAVIGSASLLLTLANRNISLSERIRALSKELRDLHQAPLSAAIPVDRVRSISSQLRCFHTRYSINTVAFGLQFVTIPCFVAAYFVSASSGSTFTALLILSLASAAFVAGLCCTAYDLFLSQRTITCELKYSEDMAATLLVRETVLDAKDTNTVIHFNSTFNDIWFKNRFIAQAAPESERQRECMNVWFRYFGLHNEQYHFFKNDVLNKKIYFQWLSYARSLAMMRLTVGDINIIQAWEEFSPLVPDQEFVEKFSAVIKGTKSFDDIFP